MCSFVLTFMLHGNLIAVCAMLCLSKAKRDAEIGNKNGKNEKGRLNKWEKCGWEKFRSQKCRKVARCEDRFEWLSHAFIKMNVRERERDIESDVAVLQCTHPNMHTNTTPSTPPKPWMFEYSALFWLSFLIYAHIYCLISFKLVFVCVTSFSCVTVFDVCSCLSLSLCHFHSLKH